jgi:FkbH-like protein
LRTTLDHLQLGNTSVLCQFIADDLVPTLDEFDMRGATDAELHEQVHAFYAAPINLEMGPTLRTGLFARAPDDQILMVKLHHVVADGWSLGIIARHLRQYYQDARQGASQETKAVGAGSYTDFSLDQIEFLSQPEGLRHIEFWRGALSPAIPGLEFGNKDRRPAVRRSVGATLTFEIGAEEQARITECARSLNATAFAVLLASFQVLLFNRARKSDVCVGVPTLGREGETFQDTVGYFVNLVALRSRRPKPLTFREHTKLTGQEIATALDHRDVPFAALVESMQVTRDPSRTPIFQTLFNLLSRRILGEVVDLIYPSPKEIAIDFGGLSASAFAIDQQEGQFDLTLEFVDRGDGLLGLFKYCTDLFSPDEARAMVDELRQLLVTVVSNPDLVVVKPAEEATALPSADATAKSQLVVAATFTAEAMLDCFDFWFDRLGWRSAVTFAPFNQIFQTLLDPASPLRRNPASPAAIMLRLDDLLGRSDGPSNEGADLETAECDERLRTNMNDLVRAIEVAAQAASAPLIVAVCPSSPALQAIPAESSLRQAFIGQVQSIKGVHVLSPAALAMWYPVADFYEPMGETIGNIPYTPKFLTALATGIVRTLHAVTARPCKALAIDCDHTLWTGVVGEEGVQDVVIGPLQREFQEFLIEQYKAGVVLCLCSKNQEADVWRVFDEHPDMVLRRQHIGFARINWESKSANIRDLAAEINIGVDSFVLLDDSPVERGEVRANAPAILVAEFPEDWSQRVPYLRQLWPLDHAFMTDADRIRSEHYRSDLSRTQLQKSTSSLGDFLAKLELEVEIHQALPSEFDRLAQLSIRTNQFNTTTRRMTAAEVEHHARSPECFVCAAHVRDRFGDYGLVGSAFTLVQEDKRLVVDAFLLSCRALGRGVEHRIAAWLGELAKVHGCTKVAFPIKTTERNEPARGFLGKLQRFCKGEFLADGTLQVGSADLADLRWDPDKEAADEAQAKDTVQASEEPSSTRDDRVVSIASSLGTVEAILAATTEHRRNKHRLPPSESRRSREQEIPTSDLERTISDAWKRVLSLDELGIHENFFERGGTSVLVAQLAIDLKRQGLGVSIIDLFQYPTVGALANHLSQSKSAPQGDARNALPSSSASLAGNRRAAPFERLREHRRR